MMLARAAALLLCASRDRYVMRHRPRLSVGQHYGTDARLL